MLETSFCQAQKHCSGTSLSSSLHAVTRALLLSPTDGCCLHTHGCVCICLVDLPALNLKAPFAVCFLLLSLLFLFFCIMFLFCSVACLFVSAGSAHGLIGFLSAFCTQHSLLLHHCKIPRLSHSSVVLVTSLLL